MSDVQSTDAAETPTAETAPRNLRGFWCLFATQFQGAFSDNVYKFLVTFVIMRQLPPGDRDRLVPLVGVIFALPFILFSMAGGHLADRYSKRTVAVWVKIAEILVMALAVLGFGWKSIPLMLAVIFLMSAQSAFFGPTKYGLLPELLPEKQLSWGNGFIGLGTFLAVITGTMAAGGLSDRFQTNQLWSGALLVALACLGTTTSLGISRLPAADPTKRFRVNFLGDLWAQFQLIRRDRLLLIAVLSSNYIWFLGALLQPTLLFYGKDVFHLTDLQSAYLQGALAVGIALGSVTSGYLSAKKIEIALVPVGALGLAIFGALLARHGLTLPVFVGNLALLGFWGGFYVVPVNALVQHRPDPGSKGGVIAASAFLSWVGIFGASGLFYLLRNTLQLELREIILFGAGLSLLGTILFVSVLPESVFRVILWFFTHTLYRVRVLGRDNIPARGGALFVCNHLSLADALLLQASTDRPIRFVMYKGIYEMPLIKPWAKVSGAIPISSELRPREMIQSLRTASDAIRAGEVVCIFAEGQITRIGQMLPFRRGFQKIMKDVEAPIVPVALDGVWGSLFSFDKHRFIWKWPGRIPHRVTVNYGKPLPHTASPFEVRQQVQELMAQAWRTRRARMHPLHRAFVHTARRHPFRQAMADAQHAKVSFGSTLVRTIVMARRLRHIWAGQKMVGLLLPPSVAGSLANWAALLCGKVPVNLNYTLSEESLASCIRQCDIKTVLTARVFLEKVKLKLPGEVVFLEDVLGRTAEGPQPQQSNAQDAGENHLPPTAPQPLRPGTGRAPTFGEKLTAVLMAGLFPAGLLERCLGCERKARLDDLATVIFSSGSTGEPKGVMLSHYNVKSNIEQLGQVFAPTGQDCFLGVLPFFHSFGFTGTMALPSVMGVRVAYHANPLDAKTIGELVCDHEVTFLLATPTFLQFYMRGCSPDQFGSLRLVAVGAEKLPERLANAFEEQFGIRPYEAYGCTECAPAVTVNTHDFRAAGFRQVGAKKGKIGHPLPGVCVRIVDPATGEPRPVGEPGLLLVRGPNIMRGYLGKPEKTAEVLRDGWYATGDIATQDEDGFLQITDRMSRFSKIGGEMVPHIKVEERLHELAGSTEHNFFVVGVPDEKKGERLVVLHKLPSDQLPACLEKLAQCDLPNLWKPRTDAFFHVDAFPLLGSGKLDLRKAKETAVQLAGRSE